MITKFLPVQPHILFSPKGEKRNKQQDSAFLNMISLNSKKYCYFVAGSRWSEFVQLINAIKFIFHIFSRYFVVLNLVFFVPNVVLICESFFSHGYDVSSVVKFWICYVFCNIKIIRFCDLKKLSLCKITKTQFL